MAHERRRAILVNEGDDGLQEAHDPRNKTNPEAALIKNPLLHSHLDRLRMRRSLLEDRAVLG